jgi:hypothetical protein
MIHVINKCSLLAGKLAVVGGPVRKKLKGIVKVSSIRHFDLTPNPKKSDKVKCRLQFLVLQLVDLRKSRLIRVSFREKIHPSKT